MRVGKMAGSDNPTGPMIHVAGSEPASLRAIGKASQLPERYGLDVLWFKK